jgi:hypothetical protein
MNWSRIKEDRLNGTFRSFEPVDLVLKQCEKNKKKRVLSVTSDDDDGGGDNEERNQQEAEEDYGTHDGDNEDGLDVIGKQEEEEEDDEKQQQQKSFTQRTEATACPELVAIETMPDEQFSSVFKDRERVSDDRFNWDSTNEKEISPSINVIHSITDIQSTSDLLRFLQSVSRDTRFLAKTIDDVLEDMWFVLKEILDVSYTHKNETVTTPATKKLLTARKLRKKESPEDKVDGLFFNPRNLAASICTQAIRKEWFPRRDRQLIKDEYLVMIRQMIARNALTRSVKRSTIPGIFAIIPKNTTTIRGPLFPLMPSVPSLTDRPVKEEKKMNSILEKCSEYAVHLHAGVCMSITRFLYRKTRLHVCPRRLFFATEPLVFKAMVENRFKIEWSQWMTPSLPEKNYTLITRSLPSGLIHVVPLICQYWFNPHTVLPPSYAAFTRYIHHTLQPKITHLSSLSRLTKESFWTPARLQQKKKQQQEVDSSDRFDQWYAENKESERNGLLYHLHLSESKDVNLFVDDTNNRVHDADGFRLGMTGRIRWYLSHVVEYTSGLESKFCQWALSPTENGIEIVSRLALIIYPEPNTNSSEGAVYEQGISRGIVLAAEVFSAIVHVKRSYVVRPSEVHGDQLSNLTVLSRLQPVMGRPHTSAKKPAFTPLTMFLLGKTIFEWMVTKRDTEVNELVTAIEQEAIEHLDEWSNDITVKRAETIDLQTRSDSTTRSIAFVVFERIRELQCLSRFFKVVFGSFDHIAFKDWFDCKSKTGGEQLHWVTAVSFYLARSWIYRLLPDTCKIYREYKQLAKEPKLAFRAEFTDVFTRSLASTTTTDAQPKKEDEKSTVVKESSPPVQALPSPQSPPPQPSVSFLRPSKSNKRLKPSTTTSSRQSRLAETLTSDSKLNSFLKMFSE